jgi:porin
MLLDDIGHDGVPATGDEKSQMRTEKRRLTLTVSMLAMLSASQASAADLGIPGSGPTKAPAQPATDGYFFNRQPMGAEIGKTLADYGIYINGRTFNNVVSNVSGGLKTGSFYEGFTVLGVDFDLQRIAGIQGATFHFSVNDMNGQNYFPYSGGLYPFNRVWSYNAAARLNEFSYEQTLFDDRVNIRVGRLPPGAEFDFSSVYCGFVTGFCAVPAPYAYTKAYPAYNTASWGSVMQVKLTDAYYFNVAAYENEPVLGTQGHYGWPGEDWDGDKANGVVLPMQFGYRTTYANDLHPKSWAVGFFYNTGKYSDPHYNTQGQILALNGGAPRQDQGSSGFWLQAQQGYGAPTRRTNAA